MPFTPEEEKQLDYKMLDEWGVESQLDQMIEECAELIVAVQHYRRHRVDGRSVAEEMGDVQNCINQFKDIFPDFESQRQAKLERAAKLLKDCPKNKEAKP